MAVIKKRFPGGLDIGANSIKFLQLARDQEGALRIAKVIVEELPKEAQENLKDRNQIVAKALKRVVDANNIGGKCFAAAPWTSIKLNLIKLSQMPSGEIDNAVQWEIRQITQTDLSNIALDYVVLEGQKGGFLGNQIAVLAITAVKSDISEHAALLESAGLTPLAMDIETLADLAALGYSVKSAPGEVLLFMDFGAGKTSLNILCNNELISTRYLNVTGNSLTKAIAESAQLSWEEAEAAKKAVDLMPKAAAPGDAAVKAREAILPLLENMVQDIDHTFKYFSYQVTQSKVTRFNKLVLSGGASRLASLAPFLRERLNVDVQAINSLSMFKAQEEYAGMDMEDLSPRLNVALGLALRGIE